jgi:hypothetical protein
MGVSFTSLQMTLRIAHGDLRLACGCLFMETHFMKLQANSYCADGLELGSECCTWRSRSVSLCGLPVRGWVIVAARRLHFPIASLTADRWSSSRAYILRTDLLERWHPMMVPHWKLLSSSVRPFYWQCLSMAIAWLCARIYTAVSNRLGLNSSIHLFEGVSTYFCIYTAPVSIASTSSEPHTEPGESVKVQHPGSVNPLSVHYNP